MSDFPNTENMPVSENGLETIYGGSVGVNRILKTLKDLSLNFTDKPYQTFLINIYTLADNVYEKNISLSKFNTKLHTEMAILITYIEAYFSNINSVGHIPTIVFYAPSYSIIPFTRMRKIKPNTHKENIIKLYEKFIKLNFKSSLDRIIETVPNSNKFIIPVGKNCLPHIDLIKYMRGIQLSPYINTNSKIALISHCMLDLHICKHLSNVNLLERYTGRMLTKKDFNKKLDSSGMIPFNPNTHQLFGDSLHIVPLIKGKERKELIARAISGKWKGLTDISIFADIKKHTSILDTHLLKRIRF